MPLALTAGPTAVHAAKATRKKITRTINFEFIISSIHAHPPRSGLPRNITPFFTGFGPTGHFVLDFAGKPNVAARISRIGNLITLRSNVIRPQASCS